MSAQTDIEAAKRALDPAERQAKLKQALDKAKSEAHTERNLRVLDAAEVKDLRRTVGRQAREIEVLKAAVALQIEPDHSAEAVERAKAVAARAQDAKRIAETARDEAKTRAEAADKARSKAEADAEHTEKHADRLVRQAEKVRDEALDKASKAEAKGFKRGVDALEKAYFTAVVQVQRGIPGTIKVLNEGVDEDIAMDIALKASDIVDRFRDQIKLDEDE